MTLTRKKEVIKHEKETRKAHNLAYKGSRYAQRSPPEKKLKASRLQGKHLEQEQESQGALPAGKNQARSSPVQGTELEDENRTRERPDKIKAEPVKFISRRELEELKVVGMIKEEAQGWDEPTLNKVGEKTVEFTNRPKLEHVNSTRGLPDKAGKIPKRKDAMQPQGKRTKVRKNLKITEQLKVFTKELPPTLPSIGTKTCLEVEGGAGSLPWEQTLSLSRNDTSEAVLKCKSAFITCEFYKGGILIPEFVEDLEAKDNHICNCHSQNAIIFYTCICQNEVS